MLGGGAITGTTMISNTPGGEDDFRKYGLPGGSQTAPRSCYQHPNISRKQRAKL
jgi:hypothetical protein